MISSYNLYILEVPLFDSGKGFSFDVFGVLSFADLIVLSCKVLIISIDLLRISALFI